MNSLNPARRRAERFDDAVEGSSAVAPDPELTALLELVGALREAPQPAARPAFVADLRSSLLAAAETELAPAEVTGQRRTPATTEPDAVPSAPRRPRRERRFAVALGGLALVGATTTMAVAAQSALPGDVLYPVKRAIEDTDTSLTAGDHRGTELLDHATVRLDELDQLSGGSWTVARTEAAEGALTTFGDQATEASDLLIADYRDDGGERSITELRDFTAGSIDQLSALESTLPADLRPALVDAAQVLVGIDQQAADLCPECGTGILDLPGSLVSAVLPLDGAEPEADQGEVTSADAEAPTGQLLEPQAKATAKPTTKASVPTVPTVPTAPPLTQAPEVATPTTGPTGSGNVTDPTKTKGAKKKVDDTVDDVTGLVNGVVGGLVGGTPTPTNPAPNVGQVVEGTLGTINELTGQLLNPAKK